MKRLNFGCGNVILKGYDNIDIQKGEGISKSFDFNKFPYPIKDNLYDYVFSRSVLEHLENPERALNELWRICKDQAEIRLILPYYNNKASYTDIQHKNYFSDVTFINFCNNATKINKQKRFEIISLILFPTRIGLLIPKSFRNKLSNVFSGIISGIDVRIRVNKRIVMTEEQFYKIKEARSGK